MSDANEEALEQAYQLIEAEKLAEAEALLKPVLERDPNNVDGWWLYAHSVKDPETARMALNKVLSLDSAYEGAQELLERLDDTYHPTEVSALSADDDIVFDDFEEFDDTGREDDLLGPEDDFIFDEDVLPVDTGEREQVRGGRRLLLLIPILLLILIIVVVVVIINPFAGSSTPEATVNIVVQQTAPTGEATEDTVMQDDQPSFTVDTVSDDVSTAVADALADFDIVDSNIGMIATDLGNTLVAGVCSSDAAREVLDNAMNAIAAVSSTVGSGIDAIGVALVDCANESQVLRVIAVPTDSAVAFSSGALDQHEYQAQWQPVA